MLPKIRLLSEYVELAAQRKPEVALPFLGQVENSPFSEGFSYLFTAYSKTGKTELMIRLALEWGSHRILWITEESQFVWEKRAVALGIGVEGNHVGMCHAMGLPLKDIGQAVDETEWDILVVDTVKVLQIIDENDPTEVMKRFRPLLAKQQREGKTIIFLHHTRKAGGVHGLGAAGSGAFTAAVDKSLFIDRVREKNQRRLFGDGRIIPIEDIFYMLENGEMSVVKKEVSLSVRLLEVLTESWQSTKELTEALNPAPADAGKALRVMVKQGKVERDPEKGGQGTTFYWRRAE